MNLFQVVVLNVKVFSTNQTVKLTLIIHYKEIRISHMYKAFIADFVTCLILIQIRSKPFCGNLFDIA